VYSNIITDNEAYTGGTSKANAIPFSLTPLSGISHYYFNSGQGVTGVETGVFEITSAGTYRINAFINYTYTDVFTGSSAYGLRDFGNTLTGFYGTGPLYPIGAPFFSLHAGLRRLTPPSHLVELFRSIHFTLHRWILIQTYISQHHLKSS